MLCQLMRLSPAAARDTLVGQSKVSATEIAISRARLYCNRKVQTRAAAECDLNNSLNAVT